MQLMEKMKGYVKYPPRYPHASNAVTHSVRSELFKTK